MHINVRGDVRAVTRDLTRLSASVVVPARTRALNRTAQQIRTRAVRAASKELNIKQKLIKGRLGKLRRASYQRESAVFYAYLPPMPARIIKTRVSRRNGWKHRQHHYDEAFAARVGDGRQFTSTGGVGVFQRTRRARTASGRDSRGRLRRGRLPITQVRVDVGPTIQRHTNRYVDRWGALAFRRNFTRELKYRLSRL